MTVPRGITEGLRIVEGGDGFRLLDGGDTPLLIVADHASNRVPDDIDLGIAPDLLDEHIAVDGGVAPLAAMLAQALRCRAVLGNVSRLVVDLNREEDSPALVPVVSDGIAIPGNADADRAARLDRFHRPYHAEVERQIARLERPFILSLHSFTPRLRARGGEGRPWHIGILYNNDRRAAELAIARLEAQQFGEGKLVVGDQQPYSGKLLNYTMNRHAEARGIPYLCLEIRQDVIADFVEGPAFAMLLAVIETCGVVLAWETP